MQTIYLDISNRGVVPCIEAKQSEVGRKFVAIITDNGVPYNIPVDALLSVWYEGDTDAGNYSSVGDRSAFIIEGNKITVELVAQMLLKPGRGEMCLSVSHGDGREINTWNICYNVEYKPGVGSSVPTEYYTALTDAAASAAAKVGLAAEQAVIAGDHASTAAGYAAEAEEHKEAAENAVKDAQNVASQVFANEIAAFKNIAFPVGYIFQWNKVDGSNIDLSTAEKVAAHFGIGTWEQIKDVFLYSAGEYADAGTTGGEREHTLTVEEMPPHTHGLRYFGAFSAGGAYTALRTRSEDRYDGINDAAEETGGGQPFNIMPPYLAVYVWKRIA